MIGIVKPVKEGMNPIMKRIPVKLYRTKGRWIDPRFEVVAHLEKEFVAGIGPAGDLQVQHLFAVQGLLECLEGYLGHGGPGRANGIGNVVDKLFSGAEGGVAFETLGKK